MGRCAIRHTRRGRECHLRWPAAIVAASSPSAATATAPTSTSPAATAAAITVPACEAASRTVPCQLSSVAELNHSLVRPLAINAIWLQQLLRCAVPAPNVPPLQRGTGTLVSLHWLCWLPHAPHSHRWSRLWHRPPWLAQHRASSTWGCLVSRQGMLRLVVRRRGMRLEC